MDSINALKGYGKVTDQENQIQTPNPKLASRKTLITTTIAVLSIVILTITIVGLIATAIIHDSNEPPESAESLRTICAVTQHPDSCFTSLSAALSTNGSDPDPKTRIDPVSIFRISLQVSSKELSNLSYSFRSINDIPQEDAAVKDCVSLVGDALSQLKDSALAVLKTEEKIGDVRTWISAAMTDLETCSDGLDEMGSVVSDGIKERLQASKEMMSNSLAIVSSMKKLLDKFHSSLP